jgi:CheY-like chemotaxis protein
MTTTTHRLVLLGFSAFETSTLASSFRLGGSRSHRYELVPTLAGSELALVAADHAASVQAVLAADRQAHTVFIGGKAPPGAGAWLPRPIAASLVLRELDALVALIVALTAAAAPAELPVPTAADDGPDTVAAVLDLEPVAVPQPPEPLPEPVPQPAAELLAVNDPPVLPGAQVVVAAPEPEPIPRPEPLRTLLVDDSDLALRYLQSRLAPWSLRIDRATTDAQALARLDRQDYDLVFLDVELGPNSDIDGLALCQHIKRRPAAGTAAHAMVVLVSAHASELDRVRGSLAGCDGYLPKPLDATELPRLMQRLGVPRELAEGAPLQP